MALASRTPASRASASASQLGLRLHSSWSGLKLVGVQPRRNCRQREKKEKCRGRVVYASLFGVGAPEALVIGVVALLVFGPKGLAEVARNLGKTLRTFQPTIRELQEVSREFKSTLEQEIGLNDVKSSVNNTYRPTSLPNENQQAVVDPNGVPTKPYTSEDLLKVTEEQLAGASTQTELFDPQATDSTTTEASAATPEVKTSAASTEGPVTPEVEVKTSATSPEGPATSGVKTSATSPEGPATSENERL